MLSKSNITHILLLAILAVTIITTLPGLSGPLVFDDTQSLAPLLSGKTKDYVSIIFGNNSGPLGRSVSMASFVINYWISGRIVPYELKLTNLIIHLSNGVLLYILTIILLKRYYPKHHIFLALGVTALWLLNPVNISTSLYIVQRMALLSCFFVLLGCLVYALTRTNALRPKPLGYGGVLACWILATLSKENGILLPVYIFLIEACCFDFLLPKIKNSRSLKYTIPILMLMLGLGGGAAVKHAGLLDYSNREFTLSERLVTQPPVIMDYIHQTLLPSHANTSLYNDDYIVKETFWNTETLISTGILALATMFALVALLKGKFKILAFGLLFFIAGHSLESTIFPLEIYFSHRNYLPSVGLCIATIVGIWLLAKSRVSFRVGTILIASYFSFLIFQSWQTAQSWSSRASMTVNGFLQHPYSVRANLEMTQLLVDKGKFQQSLQANEQILKRRPDAALRSYIQRFYIYCKFGENVPTHEYDAFPEFIKFGHYLELSTALDNLLHSYQQRQCRFVDIKKIALMLADEVDRTIAKNPSYVHRLWSVEYYIINYLFSVGDNETAISRLKKSALQGNNKAQLYFESLNQKWPDILSDPESVSHFQIFDN